MSTWTTSVTMGSLVAGRLTLGVYGAEPFADVPLGHQGLRPVFPRGLLQGDNQSVLHDGRSSAARQQTAHQVFRLILLAGLLVYPAAAVFAADTPQSVTGFRGDRNGYHANCNPPITWNDLTGENIAWRTRLPNWCLGLPIVAGDRVFAMSEPER
jgi:hypothetical protein